MSSQAVSRGRDSDLPWRRALALQTVYSYSELLPLLSLRVHSLQRVNKIPQAVDDGVLATLASLAFCFKLVIQACTGCVFQQVFSPPSGMNTDGSPAPPADHPPMIVPCA